MTNMPGEEERGGCAMNSKCCCVFPYISSEKNREGEGRGPTIKRDGRRPRLFVAVDKREKKHIKIWEYNI